jgi:hypothetical protein
MSDPELHEITLIAPKKNPSLRRFPAWFYTSTKTACGLRARKLCRPTLVRLASMALATAQ